MCFGAQFVVDTSGIFDENAAGLCFHHFDKLSIFNIYIYIYSLLIALAISAVTSRVVEARKEQTSFNI